MVVPLLLLRAAGLPGDLGADARDVLCERTRPQRGQGQVQAQGPALLDTAAAGAARLRLRDLAARPLALAPVTQVQLLVAAELGARARRPGPGQAPDGGSSGGVAGRLGGVDAWMARVRGEGEGAGGGSAGAALTVTLAPVVPAPARPRAAPSFPQDTSRTLTPAHAAASPPEMPQSPVQRLQQGRAWQLLDALALPSPSASLMSPRAGVAGGRVGGAAAASTKGGSMGSVGSVGSMGLTQRRSRAPLPLLRKWGPRAGGAEARAIRDGGGFGSIIGRNSFQRAKPDALKLLAAIMEIYSGA